MPDNENFTLGIDIIGKGIQKAKKELESLQKTLKEIQQNSDINVNASVKSGKTSKSQTKSEKAEEKAAKAQEKAAKVQNKSEKKQEEAAEIQIKNEKSGARNRGIAEYKTTRLLDKITGVIAAIAVGQRVIEHIASRYREVTERDRAYENARINTGISATQSQAIGQIIRKYGGDVNSGATLMTDMQHKLLSWYRGWSDIPAPLAAQGADVFYNEKGQRTNNPIEILRNINKAVAKMSENDRLIYLKAWGLPEPLIASMNSGNFEEEYSQYLKHPVLTDESIKQGVKNLEKENQFGEGQKLWYKRLGEWLFSLVSDDIENQRTFGGIWEGVKPLLWLGVLKIAKWGLGKLGIGTAAKVGAGAAGTGLGIGAGAAGAGALGFLPTALLGSLFGYMGYISGNWLDQEFTGKYLDKLPLDKFFEKFDQRKPTAPIDLKTPAPVKGIPNQYVQPGMDPFGAWLNSTNTPLNNWSPASTLGNSYAENGSSSSGDTSITIGDIIVHSNASNPVEVGKTVAAELRRVMVEYGSTIKA